MQLEQTVTVIVIKMQLEQTVTVIVLISFGCLAEVAGKPFIESGEDCPRGIFLLDQTSLPSSSMSSTSSSSSASSTRLCVQVCPLGFYPSIAFKNKPSLSDINLGSNEKHVTLQCLPCKPECTACLGPNTSACFVCDAQWIKKYKSSFKHESKSERLVILNATTNDCQLWHTISSNQRKREFQHKHKGRSLGTVALLVVLSAMFSAVLVFSLYRLHWEKRRQGNQCARSDTSPLRWLKRCWDRQNYSVITTNQGTSDRATWTNSEEESVIFSADEVSTRNVE